MEQAIRTQAGTAARTGALHSLLTITQKLNSTLDVETLLDYLVAEAVGLCAAEGGYAGLRKPEGMVCSRYLRGAQFVPLRYCWPAGHGTPGWVMVHKVSYLTNDARNDVQIVPGLREKLGVRSQLTTPILNVQGDAIGFFEIHNKKDPSGFTETDKESLLIISHMAAVAIQNALAYQKLVEAERLARGEAEELRRSRAQLKRSHDVLRALGAHLHSVREEERTLLAREIHDELSGALTALKMDLSSLASRLAPEQAPLLEKAGSMSRLIDATIQSVRVIATKLRPRILDDFGLTAAIEWEAREFEARSGIGCRLELPREDPKLDPRGSTTVFRIFQEALTNIARHARATQVEVTLKEESSMLVLEVRDNGRGIEPHEISSPQALGLLSMRERALVLSGEVHIIGVPGKGTAVSVKLPLEKA